MSVRERLVEAGVELLERDGLSQLTLRAIARRAGVSHGAPRHHFPTYASLLSAVARVGVDDLDEVLTPALRSSDPARAIREAALRYVEFATRRPEMFELIGRHDLLDGGGGDLRTVTSTWMGMVSRRVREIDPAADDTVVLALWSGIHGLAVIASRRTAEGAAGTVPDVERVTDALIARLLGPVAGPSGA